MSESKSYPCPACGSEITPKSVFCPKCGFVSAFRLAITIFGVCVYLVLFLAVPAILTAFVFYLLPFQP